MAKAKPSDFIIKVKLRPFEPNHKFVQMNRGRDLFYRSHMPIDEDPHTFIYDKMFDSCPLNWADFKKIKVESEL